jgi:dTMP kinase
MTGIFINFEGIEAAGKSSQISRIKDYLDTIGVKSLMTREPGGTPFAELIRDLTKRKDVDEEIYPMTEALLFFASRSQHYTKVIKPALEAGIVCLCDRFSPSTVAYQSLRGGLSQDEVMNLHNFVLGDVWPDVNVLIDITPDESRVRMGTRGEMDRIELSLGDGISLLRENYLEQARADHSNFVVVDGMEHPDVVYEKIKCIINAAIEKSGIYGNEKRG